MKPFAFIVVCLLVVHQLPAQQYVITGNIKSNNGKPLEDVSIWSDQGTYSTISDSKGYYKLKIDSPVTCLVFSKIGFEKMIRKIEKQSFPLEINITMHEKLLELKQATVIANTIKPITKNKGPGVVDYDFWSDDTLLIITAYNNVSNSILNLITVYGDTLSQLKIPERPQSLFTDCIGNHYIVCREVYFEIFRNDNNQLELYDPQPIEQFENVQKPCMANFNNLFYYSIILGQSVQEMGTFKYKTNNYIQTYVAYNNENNTYKQFTTIADRKLLRQLFEEKSRVDENYRNGSYVSAFQAQMDFYFAHKIIFKEVYAPLFKKGKRFYIFNFPQSCIEAYSYNAVLTAKTPLQFGNEFSFKRLILADRFNENLFAVYENKSLLQLCEVNIETGQLERCTTIAYPLAENIKVFNNKIYFLYKDYSTDETGVLYRQRIENQ